MYTLKSNSLWSCHSHIDGFTEEEVRNGGLGCYIVTEGLLLYNHMQP